MTLADAGKTISSTIHQSSVAGKIDCKNLIR